MHLAVSFAPIGRGMEVDLVDERVLSGEYDGSIRVARHFEATSEACGGLRGRRSNIMNPKAPAIARSLIAAFLCRNMTLKSAMRMAPF